MATFLVLAARDEGDEPSKFVVHGGKITTADQAVEHFIYVNRFIDAEGNPRKWHSVVKVSDDPVSLSDVDPMPTPLQKIVGK